MCQMSIVFSPRLEGVEKETLPTLPLFQRKGIWQVTQAQKQNKCNPVHWNQTATLRSPFCYRSNQGHVAEQENSCETQLGAFWEALQMYLLEHTHHGGPCVSPCYLHTETVTETPHQARSCGPVHTTADSTAAGITPTMLTRLSALTLLSGLCLEASCFDYDLQGAGFACQKLPKKYTHDL